MGASLHTAIRRREELIVVGTAGLFLLIVTLLPLLVAALRFEAPGPDIPAPHLVLRVLGQFSGTGGLMLRSLGIAGAVTVLALLLGVPLGVWLTKADVPGRKWALLLHAFPMFLPPFLLALGWFHLLGRQGLVGSEATSQALFSAPGVVGVLALTFSPVVTCMIALGLHAIDPSLEEAARLVARPWRVITRILLPLAWPAGALAALIVFALSFSELGVPMFLRVRAYPAAVFARLGGAEYAPGEAFQLVLPLLGIALVLLWLERRLMHQRSFAVLGLRREENPVLSLGRWRGVAAGLCWLASAVSVLPFFGLALRAAGVAFAAVPTWLGASLVNSLASAGIAATVIVALGLILGRGLARQTTGSEFFDAVAVLGFFTPAGLLGVGLIAVWNRPATRLIYGSLAIIVIGYVARYAVVGVRTIATVITQASPHFEEAAAACGATFLKRLLGIVLPMHARGVAAAWLLALVFCLRDLETAVLYYPPNGEPLPVRILTLEANGPEPVVAALALVHVLLTALVLCTGAVLLPRSRR